MKYSFATEPQGKNEGGKEPPSRSIKQFFKLFKFEKLDTLTRGLPEEDRV